MRTALVAALLSVGIAAQAASPVPRPAKELTILDLSGKQTLLSSYKGKVVMLACVFTTCPHCQHLSQFVMSKLQSDLGARGFQALDVAFNDEVNTPNQAANAQVAASFQKQFAPVYPVGFAPRESIMSFLGLSVMDAHWVVPQIVIMDRKGVIRAQSAAGGTEELQTESYLRTLLDGLLKEGATPASNTKKPAAPKADKKAS